MRPRPVLYLFQCGSSHYYALSWDKTGCNIPPILGRNRWLLRAEVYPEEIEPDLILAADAVYNRGYCLMRDRDFKLAS